jgi:hypothetical protein
MSENEIMASSRNIDQVLIDQMMDVQNETPLMKRLERINVSKGTLKEIIGNSTFEEDLYEHCRGQILLPAMAKILNSLVTKAAGGSIQATRTYLELIKRLNTKQDVNVNILQYQGLSDSELDRRLEAELSRHGIDLDNPVIDGEITTQEKLDG